MNWLNDPLFCQNVIFTCLIWSKWRSSTLGPMVSPVPALVARPRDVFFLNTIQETTRFLRRNTINDATESASGKQAPASTWATSFLRVLSLTRLKPSSVVRRRDATRTTVLITARIVGTATAIIVLVIALVSSWRLSAVLCSSCNSRWWELSLLLSSSKALALASCRTAPSSAVHSPSNFSVSPPHHPILKPRHLFSF